MNLSDRIGASGPTPVPPPNGSHGPMPGPPPQGYDLQRTLLHPVPPNGQSPLAERQVRGPLAEARRRVHEALLTMLGPQLYETSDEAELSAKVKDAIADVLAREELPLSSADRTRIGREVSDEILGHGPIEPLLRDADVTEVMVNGPSQIFVERYGRIYPVDAEFVDENHLRRVIDRIVTRMGRRIDESSPMVDARLPDGSRVNAVVPPIAIDGSMLTIRKFPADPYTVDDLVAFGTMTRAVAELLSACVKGRLDIVISGGTGSGKTTTLNVMSGF